MRGGYLCRAEERAAAQFANAEAVGYFSRALDLTLEEDPVGRHEFLLACEGVYALQGERKAQWPDLSRLQDLASALGDDARHAQVAVRQAYCASCSAHYSAAIAAAQKAVRLSHAADDVRTETDSYREWGRALRFQGTSLHHGSGLSRP